MTDWRLSAACKPLPNQVRNHLFFHPEGKGDADYYQIAINICGVCEVRQQCLEFALTPDQFGNPQCEFGVWGGKIMEAHRSRGVGEVLEEVEANFFGEELVPADFDLSQCCWCRRFCLTKEMFPAFAMADRLWCKDCKNCFSRQTLRANKEGKPRGWAFQTAFKLCRSHRWDANRKNKKQDRAKMVVPAQPGKEKPVKVEVQCPWCRLVVPEGQLIFRGQARKVCKKCFACYRRLKEVREPGDPHGWALRSAKLLCAARQWDAVDRVKKTG